MKKRSYMITFQDKENLLKGKKSFFFHKKVENVNMLREKIKEVHFKKEDLFLWDGKNLKKLFFFKNNTTYALKLPEGLKTPALQINGIYMHPVKEYNDFNKWARDVLKELSVKKGMKHLDICTGLGYFASNSFLKGLNVATVEISKEVIFFAFLNPTTSFREGVFNGKINLFLGDAYDVLKKKKEKWANYWDVLTFDPPKPSLSPELYTLEFFKLLYSFLKPKGKAFVYTGNPFGKGTQKPIAKRIKTLSKVVGFNNIKTSKRLRGLFLEKP